MQKTNAIRKGSIGLIGLFVAMTVCLVPVVGGKEFNAGWRTSFLVRFASGGGQRGGTGELWAHLGVSSVPGHCTCWDSIYVMLDEAGRIFATDRDRFHIKVLD